MIQNQALDYLGANKDWKKHVHKVSGNTQERNAEIWVYNARKNRKLFKKHGWLADAAQEAHRGKTAIVIGASPAIKKQIGTLRDIQHDPDFILCSVTSILKYLLENGITPKYNMIADADPSQIRFWEGLDMGLTKNTTLISSISVPRNMLDIWQGDIKFLAMGSGARLVEKKVKRWFSPLNGCGHHFHSLLSQFNTLVSVVNLIFRCNVTILVGNELSFSDRDVPYYADKEDIKDDWNRFPAPDIYGGKVYTSQMFMSLKLALEDYVGKLPGWCFNCTEAGVFGVNARYGNLPWIHQLKLQNGIAQARNVMRSGEPFYA
jgi:hypothetical protein